MLIITRRKGQRICLGHDIELVITEISRSGVKVGVIAPNSLTILRGEVRDAVEQANRDAASGDFAEPLAAPANTVVLSANADTLAVASISLPPGDAHSEG